MNVSHTTTCDMIPKKQHKDAKLTNKTNRRVFLRNTLATGAGMILLPTIIPASAIGKNGYVAASERIVMGFIGVGSQGIGNMNG